MIPVRLGQTSGTDGHRCATLGYPRVGMLQGVEGRGEIYRSVSEANGRRLIQLASKEITTGFSGAPLLDQITGRVVGMITEIAEPDRYGRMGRDHDLLTLARDETVDIGLRVVTTFVLGTYGRDSRLLPDLERIAQQDADNDVRWAAQKAVERIRHRLSGW